MIVKFNANKTVKDYSVRSSQFQGAPPMKTRVGSIVVVGTVAAILSGCGGWGMFGAQPNPMESMMAQQNAGNDMMNAIMAKQQFQQELMKNPDLPAWHA